MMDDLEGLLQRIAALQSKGTARYAPGLFPNSRLHRYLPYRRADTNVFCTAITVFTLNQIRPTLSTKARQTVDNLTEKAVAAYPAYRNRKGKPTYNNYESQPGRQFQHGYFFHRFDHFRLPDDIDDTALIYLTQAHSPSDIQAFKELLPLHANGSPFDGIERWAQNTLPAYRSLRAYSTWFGQRMSIDLDVCALCNLFLFFWDNRCR